VLSVENLVVEDGNNVFRQLEGVFVHEFFLFRIIVRLVVRDRVDDRVEVESR